jgi:hypothetical protein
LILNDLSMSKAVRCGADLGVTRSLITSNSSYVPTNTMDPAQMYDVDLHLNSLYEHIRFGQPQHVHLFHTSKCGTIPTQLHIPDKIRKEHFIFDEDAEYTGPHFFKEFEEFDRQNFSIFQNDLAEGAKISVNPYL